MADQPKLQALREEIARAAMAASCRRAGEDNLLLANAAAGADGYAIADAILALPRIKEALAGEWQAEPPIDYSDCKEEALRRLLRQRDHMARINKQYWVRAAERALIGDMGELRLRVALAKAPPTDIVQSASPPKEAKSDE